MNVISNDILLGNTISKVDGLVAGHRTTIKKLLDQASAIHNLLKTINEDLNHKLEQYRKTDEELQATSEELA